MPLFTTIAGLRTFLDSYRATHAVALVPTMGSLHRGHESLIRRAVAEADVTVVSIFVNPLQFSPSEDLARYPRNLEIDRQLCEDLGVTAIFAPDNETMGISRSPTLSDITSVLPPASMTAGLCGAVRPGHFQGVATVVAKLFHIVEPSIAYFGEKDGQQLAIVQQLVRDCHFSVEIRPCATVREPSGLALSSRNQYLSIEEKARAAILWQSLQAARESFRSGERHREALIGIVEKTLASVTDFRCQYIDLVDLRTLIPLETIEESGLLAVAGYLGNTRLIDNIRLHQRQPIIAIDGPAGAGKSTVTRQVARALGLLYLDTGAMYRAVTWLVSEAALPIEDTASISELVARSKIDLIPAENPDLPTTVLIDGQDVTLAIRTPAITARVSAISALKSVRQQLVDRQRQIGQAGGIVVEGRDIGTNVFPSADLKIFLTATPLERAKRRWRELEAGAGEKPSLETLAREIQQRDFLDSHRQLSPLKKAVDAIEVITDRLNVSQVTEKIVSLYHERVENCVKKSQD